MSGPGRPGRRVRARGGEAVQLRILLTQLTAQVPGGIGRYTEELTRAMLENRPNGWQVEGVIGRVGTDERRRVHEALPGLDALRSLRLPNRALSESWRRGLLVSGVGRGADAVFAPSLLAPLGPSAAPTVVTIHDAVPWTRPETLTPRGAAWHRDMGARAGVHAAAVTAPTGAVAEELRGLIHPRGLLEVVPGAPSGDFSPRPDAALQAVRERFALPDRFILAVGTLEPRKRLASLIRCLADARFDADPVPLVIAGPEGWGGVRVDEIAQQAGLRQGRVRALGRVSDEELVALYQLATVTAMPSADEGFGLPVIEAMASGCPVVHSDAPALIEVGGGAGVSVERERADEDESVFEARLAEVLQRVLSDDALRAELSKRGRGRASEFSWARSAKRMWELIENVVTDSRATSGRDAR